MSFLRCLTRGARSGVALLALAALATAQFGVVQREQKLSSTDGGLGTIGNDFRFGVSVAELDDFDGDGTRDALVGAHRANLGGAERGAVYVLLFNPDGTVKGRTEISSVTGGLVGPLEDHDRFGVSLCSLGDLDLDGVTDIAVGAYRDDDGAFDAGAVYVLFLRPDGTVRAEQKISALAGGFTGVLQDEDSFGWAVDAVGDLDGDGVVDLAVGASRDDGEESGLEHDFGAVYLLYLRRDGSVREHVKIAQGDQGLGALLRPRDRFGGDVVTLGDTDGDGVEDIAVGAFGDEPLKYGRVFIVRLQHDGGVKSFSEIGYQTGGFPSLLGKGDRFGCSLAADDLDGDGITDLIVGAIGDDDGGMDTGALWLLLLDATGRVRDFEKISSDFGGFGGLLHPQDNFGVGCATIGDVDRDGAVDVLVGAYQDDDGGFDRGAAWLLFRAGTGVPVADFVSQPGSGLLPLTVTFSDRSSGPITSWAWDFGDGATSSEVEPVHEYTAPGIYSVQLTVTGALGSDTLVRSRAVVVQPAGSLAADFAAKPTTGTGTLLVSFSDRSSGDPTSWWWDFGDGASSAQREPAHLYVAPGHYTVTLTAKLPGVASTRTMRDLIEVLVPPPEADFACLPPVGPLPLTVTFEDHSRTGVTAWTWDFGDGTGSHAAAPTHLYPQLGAYTVTLTVTSPGGTASVTRTDAVRVTPAARFTFNPPSAPSSGTAPITIRFTDQSVGEVTQWSWDFGDGGTSTGRNPWHLYTYGGTFPVALTVTGPTGSNTGIVPVTITEPRPDARFDNAVTSGPAALSVAFTDQSIGHITGWEWDFGDGQTSARQHPLHVYSRPGVYTVRFRVHSLGGTDGVVKRDLITVTPSLGEHPTGTRQTGTPKVGGTREIR